MTPLEDCIEATRKFPSAAAGEARVLKASSDKDEIAGLDKLVGHVAADLGLAGIAVLEGKADDIKVMLVSFFLRGPLLFFARHRS